MTKWHRKDGCTSQLTPVLTGMTGILFGLSLGWGWPGLTLANPASPLRRLSPAEVNAQLRQLPTWKLKGQGASQALVCTYRFADFVQAVAFVNQLVQPSESAKHHPDITITYNQVTLSLTTHDAGGLTDLDFQLARTIRQLRDGAPCQG